MAVAYPTTNPLHFVTQMKSCKVVKNKAYSVCRLMLGLLSIILESLIIKSGTSDSLTLSEDKVRPSQGPVSVACFSRSYFGYWAPDPANPGYLKASKIDTKCIKQPVGYTFDLDALTAETLNPAVADLVYQATELDTYNSKFHGIMWRVGAAFAGAETVLLPMNLDGRAHWNGPSLIFIMVSFPLFTLIPSPDVPNSKHV
jgi:hypothetical protein